MVFQFMAKKIIFVFLLNMKINNKNSNISFGTHLSKNFLEIIKNTNP